MDKILALVGGYANSKKCSDSAYSKRLWRPLAIAKVHVGIDDGNYGLNATPASYAQSLLSVQFNIA